MLELDDPKEERWSFWNVYCLLFKWRLLDLNDDVWSFLCINWVCNQLICLEKLWRCCTPRVRLWWTQTLNPMLCPSHIMFCDLETPGLVEMGWFWHQWVQNRKCFFLRIQGSLWTNIALSKTTVMTYFGFFCFGYGHVTSESFFHMSTKQTIRTWFHFKCLGSTR